MWGLAGSSQHAMADNSTSRTRRRKRRTAAAFPPTLDRLIHERIRLGIVSALAAGDRLSFNELKALLDTSDGNLSVHARKLEDAGYITAIKSFDDRMPKTEYELTLAGRQALETYLAQMEGIIQLARNA